MISIKENKMPDLPVCKMNCDNGLSPHLNDYDLTKFFNEHSCNLIIGKPRSGKTSWLYSWFKGTKKNQMLREVYDNIYLFQPSHSRKSMKDSIFDKLDEDKKFDELTYDNLNEVLERIKNDDEESNHAIIFDDMTAYLRKDSAVRQLLKEIVFNRRHYHVSIYFLVQTYMSVEPDIRKLFSNIVCFKCSKKEFNTIFEELIETKKDYADKIFKIVYNQPYEYLFVNTEHGKLFKKFDEILIDE
jgi:hypothetical protein